MTDVTREGLDAAQKAVAYSGLARNYLNNGETWMAVHSQVAADLSAAKSVCGFDPSLLLNEDGVSLFSTYLAAAPAKQFAAKANALNVVEYIREGILTLIPATLEESWTASLSDLSGFADRVLGNDLLASAFVTARLGDLSPEAFVVSRFEEAADFFAQSVDAEISGDMELAVKAHHQGDLAMYEGWLVQRSIDVNDRALIQTTLRWDLAMAAIDALGVLPEDPQSISWLVRSRMAWALGTEDAKRFAEVFVA